MRAIISAFLAFFLSGVATDQLNAACVGKIDIGPAFLHMDILERGHTVKRMDMWAIRADGSYMIWKGLFVKPTVLYGNGGAAKGGVFTGGLAIGHYTPLNDLIALNPQVGVTYSHVWTRIDLPQFGLEDLSERFKAWAPYLCMEVAFNIGNGWRAYVSYQYAWSRSHTEISDLVKDKSNCQGPTYSFLIEKDLSEEWSVNFGGAYNLSLTKEKHGLRASGLKVGIVRWF